MREEACGWCRRTAVGQVYIRGVRYCHGDGTPERMTCAERANGGELPAWLYPPSERSSTRLGDSNPRPTAPERP